MLFDRPLLFGTLIRRFNRFFAEIELEHFPPLFSREAEGKKIVAHCPNTGSMKGVNVPGARVAVSYHPEPERRMHYTWQLIQLEGDWVGINTMVPNRITAEALEAGLIPCFRRYSSYRQEVRYGEHSRLDFALGKAERCLVEVKNVTLVEDGLAKFPDCVSERATKHLHCLMDNIKHGGKSTVLFVIQHHAANYFGPADDLDPVYGKTLRQAVKKGMKIEAWKAKVTTEEIRLSEKVRVRL
jgi:sugar fermentation stimulation protein A